MNTERTSSHLADLSVSRVRTTDPEPVAAAPRVTEVPVQDERSELVALTMIVALVALVVWKLALHCMAVWQFVG